MARISADVALKLIVAALCLTPVLAHAGDAALEPAQRSWNVGAGAGVVYGVAYGVLGLGQLSTVVIPQPRLTVLVERRLSERLFLTFQVEGSYGWNESPASPGLFTRQAGLDAALGVRGVLNPRGLIEVSWFANAGATYRSSETHTAVAVWDPTTGASQQEARAILGRGVGVGAVAGLVLERELVDGLALRLSSSIVGLSYGLGSATTSTPDGSTVEDRRGLDVGLSFSPTLQLRFAL